MKSSTAVSSPSHVTLLRMRHVRVYPVRPYDWRTETDNEEKKR